MPAVAVLGWIIYFSLDDYDVDIVSVFVVVVGDMLLWSQQKRWALFGVDVLIVVVIVVIVIFVALECQVVQADQELRWHRLRLRGRR